MVEVLKEIVCSGWEDFDKKVRLKLGDLSDYVFRGQYNSDWRLESSFQRFLRTIGISISPTDSNPFELLVSIYDKVCKKSAFNNMNSNNPIDLVCIAQHYGLPTTHIDWTKNIDKAVFFSCCDEVTSPALHKYVSVYSFRVENIGQLVESVNMKEYLKRRGGIRIIEEFGLSLIYSENSIDNPRIDTQNGVFVKIDGFDNQKYTMDDILKKVYECYNLRKPIIYKFVIPRDMAFDKIILLHKKTGINFSSMYPDKYGFSNQAKLEFIMKKRHI